nr:reverse transcriptase domain-containing protein [Tanacetum cinerariifolium]
MADNRTMEELLQAPTEGDVPNDLIKLMMFMYSLKGNARVWENASKSDDRIDKLADQISTLVDIFAKKIVTRAPVKAVEESCVTCGGAHAYYNCPNTDSNQPSDCVATGTYNQNVSLTSGTLLSNTIPNLTGEMKVITTRSVVVYEGPSIPTPKKVVEQETEETMDKEQSNFQGSTAHIQPPVNSIPKPNVLKTLPKPNIPYPSRLHDQKLRKKATNQMEKFFQIFQDLHFDISFADALFFMPKFASTIKSLLTNKDKLFELAKIPLNENCSTMLLKKLPEKLGDPGKFLIPCDFLGMDLCHALADLDRSITRPKGVTEDVFVKAGKFHFSTDFVVVYFEADPGVPLILGRSFLRTGRALIDVYREEITLRLMMKLSLLISTILRDTPLLMMICRNSLGGNPTSTFGPILFDSSLSITLFVGSDFILEEIDAYLKDELVSPEINHADCDSEGDICLIEKLLNNDPFQLLPMDLKQGEVIKAKSSIEEPPELELKELPSHLEYAYLEGLDKLPVIISKDLKVDEKEALLKVLKSHKRVIAWKITNIKDHSALNYLLIKQDAKPRLIRWVLLLQEFDIVTRDKKRDGEPSGRPLIKSFEGVCMEKNLLISSKLVMKDPPGDIMVPSSPPRKTAYKTPIGCTPYKLVYGKSYYLPIELEHKAYWALKYVNFDLKTVGDYRKLQLNELNELCDQAYENSLIYKEKTKKIHDSKIKNRIFNVGDRVLVFNSRLKIFSRKLKTSYSGPFAITKVFPYGTVELSQPDGPNFKVNGHRVKHYFGRDVVTP